MMVRRKPQAEDTDRFSKKWFLVGLRNLFWIVMVTALIWIYADMEFTDTATITAILKLNTGESQQLELLSIKEYSLKFEISGSKSSLEEFQRELAAKGTVLSYDVSQNYKAGEKLIPSAELLEAATRLREKGVTIKNVQPRAIELDLDTIMRKTGVPVELQATGAKFEVLSAAQTVDIMVPASRWAKIEKKLGGKLPKLITKPVDLSSFQPGTTNKIKAEVLRNIAGISVTPVPDTVTFDVQIIRTSTSKKILVSVQILTPAAWAETKDTTWENYVLTRQAPADWRPELQIEGSPKDLKPENVIAYIKLTDEDKRQTSWNEREVIVSFPPKMNLKLIGSPPKLEFRLEKRKAALAAPQR